MDDEQLQRCYEGSDLFVLPTRVLECFGLIVLESLAFGLPIVSTDAGAIPELMQPILPDCIVTAGRADAMQEKVAAWLSGDIIMPTAEAMTRYARERFSSQAITPQILSFVLS